LIFRFKQKKSGQLNKYQNTDKGSLIITQKVTLSDWIQYLNSTRTASFAFFGILITITIYITGLILSTYKETHPLNTITLLITEIIFIYLNYWLVYSNKSPMNKSFNILKEIMKDGLKDVDVIKNKWYGDKMPEWKKIEEYYPRICRWMSIIFSIAGFILILYAAYITTQISNADTFNEKTFITSSGIGILSIGIALFSIGMGFLSIGIAKESDEKMKTIATSDFLGITHNFEDMKCIILGVEVDSKGKIKGKGPWPSTGRNHFLWKCEQQMKRASELLKWDIDSEYQEQLARIYYDDLLNGLEEKLDTVIEAERTNIKKMHEHIQKIKVDGKYKVYPTALLGEKEVD